MSFQRGDDHRRPRTPTLPHHRPLQDRSWRWEKLGEAFDDGAAQYAAESRIVSPTWAELDVLGAEVALRCSTNAPSRFLQVSFLRDGKVVSGPIRFETVFAANTREAQSLAVSRAKHANGIALSLSSGEVGDWGVYEVRLTTAPTTFVSPNEPAEPPKKQTGFTIGVCPSKILTRLNFPDRQAPHETAATLPPHL